MYVCMYVYYCRRCARDVCMPCMYVYSLLQALLKACMYIHLIAYVFIISLLLQDLFEDARGIMSVCRECMYILNMFIFITAGST